MFNINLLMAITDGFALGRPDSLLRFFGKAMTESRQSPGANVSINISVRSALPSFDLQMAHIRRDLDFFNRKLRAGEPDRTGERSRRRHIQRQPSARVGVAKS